MTKSIVVVATSVVFIVGIIGSLKQAHTVTFALLNDLTTGTNTVISIYTSSGVSFSESPNERVFGNWTTSLQHTNTEVFSKRFLLFNVCLLTSEDFKMKYLSIMFSHLRPIHVLFSIVLSIILIFSNSGLALAAKSSSLTKGTVQLDKIEQKTQEAIDSTTTSLKKIEKNGEGGINEIQGSADHEKMIRSKSTELPIVKQTEKSLKGI